MLIRNCPPRLKTWATHPPWDTRPWDIRDKTWATGRKTWASHSPRAGAVTLIELLVVIAVIAMLISILIPSISRARQHAKRTVCLSNQRQIAAAMYAYAGDFDDDLPIAQYLDLHGGAFVAWDTITEFGEPCNAKAGLIWEFVDGGAVQQCPSYDGPSMTTGDPYTGYNYNTTYIGRGQGEGPYLGMTESPAKTTQIRTPSRTALVGDGGYAAGANKFMRAPLDEGVAEGTVHAGGQAYRHMNRTNVVYVDGHGETTAKRYKTPGALPQNLQILGWPKNGFLSEDDRVYSRF